MNKKYLVLAFICSLGSTAVFGLGFWLFSLEPNLKGELELAGVDAQVEVYFDEVGTPHIYAQSQPDAYFALGYVVASERLFQMDFSRRIAYGQISEVLGRDFGRFTPQTVRDFYEKNIRFDSFFRSLDFAGYASQYMAKNKQKMDPMMVRIIESYFKGVNSFIENNPLPLEFYLIGYRPEPFHMQDVFAFAGLMALGLTDGLRTDLLFSDLQNDISAEKFQQIRKANRQGNSQRPEQGPMTAALKQLDEVITHMDQLVPGFKGSNSWVLSGKRSKSGFPLLGNDPHMGLGTPGPWFEAHISTPDFELYGHHTPFSPFAILGHNRHHGWGITMSTIDDLDIYKEKVDYKNKKVMHKGEWVDLIAKKHTILVRGDKDREITTYHTPHGPLFFSNYQGIVQEDIALSWAFYHPENNLFESFYRMARVNSMEDFEQAVSLIAAPGFNISYADKEGNIAHWVAGKIPVRPEGMVSDQVLEGSSGKWDWLGYRPFKENPRQINPSSGVIITANYVPQFYSAQTLPGYYQPSDRQLRLESLIAQKPRWSNEELQKVQTDQFVPEYAFFKEHLLSLVDKNVENEQPFQLLKLWKGESDVGSIGSSIFHMWTHFIMKNIIFDEMGQDRFEHFSKLPSYWNFYKYLVQNPQSSWWDDSVTIPIETAKDVAMKSWKQAIEELQQKLGSDPGDWQWGRLHTMEFFHPLGVLPGFNKIFNIGPFPAGGGYCQVDNMKASRSRTDFKVSQGPSTRRLIDFSDLSHSMGILPNGNGSTLFSPHKADQVESFLKGSYRKRQLDEKEIKRSFKKKFVLRPKSA